MSRVSYAFYIFLLSLFSRNLEVISKSKYIEPRAGAREMSGVL